MPFFPPNSLGITFLSNLISIVRVSRVCLHLIELDYSQAKRGIKMQHCFTPRNRTAPFLTKTHIAMRTASSPLGSKHFSAPLRSADGSLPSERL